MNNLFLSFYLHPSRSVSMIMSEIIMSRKIFLQKLARFHFPFLFSFPMSSTSTDRSESNSSVQYDSIFQHYGLEEQDPYLSDERTFETRSSIIDRNDNNKTKKINARTVKKSHKKTATKHAHGKHLKHGQHHHHSKVCFHYYLTNE